VGSWWDPQKLEKKAYNQIIERDDKKCGTE
jgi:hypothetical protein